MNSLIKILAKSGLLKGNLDLHLVRGSMVLIFLLFGYQKWFEYEAQTLIPFISNGLLTSTVTIIPFLPDGWDPVAGFRAMKGFVAFTMKDVVFLAVSVYLLKQDVVRASRSVADGGACYEGEEPCPRAAEPVPAK
jgi:uncharacterized membrane protein YkgB